jgi:hypothetical protein
MKKIIFAISDSTGLFEELAMINSDQIIEFLDETDDGVGVVKVFDDSKEQEWYYIDYIEVE